MKTIFGLIGFLSLLGCSIDLEKSVHPRLALSPSVAIVTTVTPTVTTSFDRETMSLDISTVRLSGMVGIEWNF
jgi:hypothetical protein